MSRMDIFFCPSSWRRGMVTAMVVGPILSLINHYDVLWGAELNCVRICKIAFTFLVPLSVSVVSSYMSIWEIRVNQIAAEQTESEQVATEL